MDYSQTSFWDTDPSLQSSGTTTPPNASAPEQRTDGSPGCECTTEMCGCSIHPNTPGEWIASMRDSLVRIFRSPVLAQALTESEAAYGPKSCGSLANYDRESCSWKTAQQSLLAASEEYSETWPSWGMTQDGVFYPLPVLVPRTYALDGGALQGIPTPSAQEAGAIDPANVKGELKPNSRVYSKKTGKHMQVTLNRYVGLWPTPTKSDGTGGPGHSGRAGGLNLRTAVQFPTPTASNTKANHMRGADKGKTRESRSYGTTGQLNPDWVEWLMGWPIGHTELKHWETGKSRSKLPQPTCCSVAG